MNIIFRYILPTFLLTLLAVAVTYKSASEARCTQAVQAATGNTIFTYCTFAKNTGRLTIILPVNAALTDVSKRENGLTFSMQVKLKAIDFETRKEVTLDSQ
jgi:hypothetical protein